jgi:hypothetical protein
MPPTAIVPPSRRHLDHVKNIEEDCAFHAVLFACTALLISSTVYT